MLDVYFLYYVDRFLCDSFTHLAYLNYILDPEMMMYVFKLIS